MYPVIWVPESITTSWDKEYPPKPEFRYLDSGLTPECLETFYFMTGESNKSLTQQQLMFLDKFDLLDRYIGYVRQHISKRPHTVYTLTVAANRDVRNNVIAVPLIVEHDTQNNAYYFIPLSVLYISPCFSVGGKNILPVSVFVLRSTLNQENGLDIQYCPLRNDFYAEFGNLCIPEIMILKEHDEFFFFMQDPRFWKRYDINHTSDAHLNIDEIFTYVNIEETFTDFSETEQ